MPRPRLSPERVRAALDAQLAALGGAASGAPPGGPPEAPSGPSGAAGLDELRRGCVAAVLAAYDAGAEPQPAALRVAVRYLLDRLAAAAPGGSVEVRVPPYAVVQCVPGPRHTRGTPPNVAEIEPGAWIALATGRVTWREAVAAGRVSASGARADLSGLLPVE